jgi:hypothetical protein
MDPPIESGAGVQTVTPIGEENAVSQIPDVGFIKLDAGPGEMLDAAVVNDDILFVVGAARDEYADDATLEIATMKRQAFHADPMFAIEVDQAGNESADRGDNGATGFLVTEG